MKEFLNHAQNNAWSEVVVEDELFLFLAPWSEVVVEDELFLFLAPWSEVVVEDE